MMNAFTSFGWRFNFNREFQLLWFGFIFCGAVLGMAGDAAARGGAAGGLRK